MSDNVALLVVGAHPDDAEITAGGFAALTAARGGRVLHVAMTNGDKGHQIIGGGPLARKRRDEARAAARAVGADSIVLDNHDGELLPTLENRYALIRIMREFRPDLVLLPRTNDYHPDHRNTAHIVQDALYMVRVPNVCPLTPHLTADPVAMYVSDAFRKPYPFEADAIVDIDSVVEQKLTAIGCHACQMFEWMPWVEWRIDLADIPADAAGRHEFLRARWDGRMRRDADKFRDQLVATYGPDRGSKVVHAEAFELCELGAPLTAETRQRLFPL